MLRRISLHLLFFCLALPSVSRDAAWGTVEQCSLRPRDEQGTCYEQALADIVQRSGPQPALAVLEQLVASAPGTQENAHHLAHHVGRIAYARYHDMPQAFTSCTNAFASGCYHGVLEAHLSGTPHLAPRDVAEICRGVRDPLRPAFTHFLCVHGLGHGLVMYFHDDMFTALTFCDALPDPFDRENCYGGAFMQNVMAFRAQGNGGHDHHGNHAGHAAPAKPRKLLDPADPLYPCTEVAVKYRRSCYLMQSSAVLLLNGGDFAKTFLACQNVPAEYRNICLQSIGRDISAFTLTNPETTKNICALVASPQSGQCLYGAAKDFIYTHTDPQRGIALCRLADEVDKKDCYKGVRDFVLDLEPDEAKRKQTCRSADARYRGLCRGSRLWFLMFF